MIFRKLFEPLQIGHLQSRNRIIMPAMHNNLGDQKDGITDIGADFYVARAAGGYGLVGVGIIDSHPYEWSSPHELFLLNERHIEIHAYLVERIKAYGAIPYAQVGVRRIWPLSEMRTIPKLSSLSSELVEELIESIIATAVRAKEAGYGAVDLLSNGGGAISIFLSQVFNDRTDKWGGNFENRMRFVIEAINGIRQRCGENFPIFSRLHSGEFIPGGYTIDGAKAIARAMAEAGVCLFNVTGGSHATTVQQLTADVPPSSYAFLAREIKEAVGDMALVASANRMTDPVIAEQLLQKGWIDLVSVGRQSLADPDWPNKVKDGVLEDIRFCVACNECLDTAAGREETIRCLVNPRAGRVSETESVGTTEKPKKVMIIGGGCVGLQAAITCAERGHNVTLFEKEPYVGGKWRLAYATPGREELFNFLYWLYRRVKKLGVEIQTGLEVTPQIVKGFAPEVLIVSSGLKPKMPSIAGIDLPHVVSADSVLEGSIVPGEKVVVVGGGGVGVETALFLARRTLADPGTQWFFSKFGTGEPEYLEKLSKESHKVTLVGRNPRVGVGLGQGTKWVLVKQLKQFGVEVLKETPVKEIKASAVVVIQNGTEKHIPADTVVIATGYRADTALYETLKDLAAVTYNLSDACIGGHTVDGIGRAFEVCAKI